MSRACDASMSRCRPMARRTAHWWSEELGYVGPPWLPEERRRRGEVSGRRSAPKRKERPQSGHKKGEGRRLGGVCLLPGQEPVRETLQDRDEEASSVGLSDNRNPERSVLGGRGGRPLPHQGRRHPGEGWSPVGMDGGIERHRGGDGEGLRPSEEKAAGARTERRPRKGLAHRGLHHRGTNEAVLHELPQRGKLPQVVEEGPTCPSKQGGQAGGESLRV